jgi:hypothetical protein
MKIKRTFTSICIILLLLFSGFTTGLISISPSIPIEKFCESSFHNIITITPDSEYYIKFDVLNFSFQESSYLSITNDWSDQIKMAIAVSPSWIHYELIRQFQIMEDKESYAILLLEASKKFIDELAFSIAHAPLGQVPSPDVLYDNVNWLYRIDEFVHYADIIDYDNHNGNYYSTIRYNILENDTIITYELPYEIYYWNIVHPGLSVETVENIYQTFWREFLFSHNDLGYPLLKELLENVSILWDLESYHQPGKRLWNEWMERHPTAIEAVSYWIGKTVPFLAMGDRPIQPNHIAHQHNGYCGELQTLAVSAQRTLLIPSIGANNIGEDHVWREFYHKGWHQNDNWWADTGGCVDIPFVYTDNWGKDMSSIFVEYGDGRISEVTSRYLHSNEIINVNFSVYDVFLRPYDGARITVLVKGLKDITWYRYQILEFLEKIWNNYSEKFNNSFIKNLYYRLIERINEIPEVIDGAMISTWNYTNKEGECSFKLGKNDEYIFLVQSPSTSLPWPLAKNTAIRFLKNGNDKDFHIVFIDISRNKVKNTLIESNGDYTAELIYNATWYNIHQNIKNRNIGIQEYIDEIDVFFMDELNFHRYRQGKPFQSFQGKIDSNQIQMINFKSDLYVLFRNNALHSSVLVDFNLHVLGEYNNNFVHIDQPRSTIFPIPICSIGDTIELSGSVSHSSQLVINEQIIQLPNGLWTYSWNTTGMLPGFYTIQLYSQNLSDTRTIQLIDKTTPIIEILEPSPLRVYSQSEFLLCMGNIHDASDIASIQLFIDEIDWKRIEQSNIFDTIINLENLTVGVHILTIRATDIAGNMQNTSVEFVIIDNSTLDPPNIVNWSSSFKRTGNWTSITIYAQSQSLIYPIKEMNVYFIQNNNLQIKKMFLYASNPVLNRHPEDPYFNQSNIPIYGCFLGDFYQGEKIECWIEAVDVSNTRNSSSAFILEC